MSSGLVTRNQDDVHLLDLEIEEAMGPTCGSSTPSESNGDDIVVIAVMGAIGVGKSSFIRTITGRTDVEVSDKLLSGPKETDKVCAYEFFHNGKIYVLVDTPGFDDTDGDVEIITKLSQWLKESLLSGQYLNGIIYLHRITDTRMGGTALRNSRVFSKLVGNHAFGNVLLATTFWEEVPSDIAAKRETELRTNANFWGSMVEKGATMTRLFQDRDSALRLIDQISDRGKVLIQAQDDLVNHTQCLPESAPVQELGNVRHALDRDMRAQNVTEQRPAATGFNVGLTLEMSSLEQFRQSIEHRLAERTRADEQDQAYRESVAEEQHRLRLAEMKKESFLQSVDQLFAAEEMKGRVAQGDDLLTQRLTSLSFKLQAGYVCVGHRPRGPCDSCKGGVMNYNFYYHCCYCGNDKFFHCGSCGNNCGVHWHPKMKQFVTYVEEQSPVSMVSAVLADGVDSVYDIVSTFISRLDRTTT